jgi:tRNA-2-methylthio-N6-dimethylallyladenosine synthase
MKQEKITFAIRTFGCQMNVNDSEKAEGLFVERGWQRTNDVLGADVVFINTCAVRRQAEEKLNGILHRLAKRRSGHELDRVIAVGGCVAQLQGEKLLEHARAVGVLVGPRSLHRLPGLIEQRLVGAGTAPGVALDVRGQSAFDVPPARQSLSPARAYVTVIEGCNQVCSFCVVPRTRGTETCRDPRSVIEEVRQRADAGILETVLLGQTVNAYRHGDTDFADLLALAASVPGVRRLRFATSHPTHLTTRVLDAMADHPVVCPHLHLPVQSGSTPVLTSMRRGYDREDYLRKIDLIRRRLPNVAIWTDIIVGYPGETDGDFDATLTLIDTVHFEGLFSFSYSPRPGTTAFRMDDDVPEAVKQERLEEVNRRQQRIQLAGNSRRIGNRESVLIEMRGRDGQLEGRAPDNRIVHCEGPETLIGSVVEVEITSAGPNALVGRRVLSPNQAESATW